MRGCLKGCLTLIGGFFALAFIAAVIGTIIGEDEQQAEESSPTTVSETQEPNPNLVSEATHGEDYPFIAPGILQCENFMGERLATIAIPGYGTFALNGSAINQIDDPGRGWSPWEEGIKRDADGELNQNAVLKLNTEFLPAALALCDSDATSVEPTSTPTQEQQAVEQPTQPVQETSEPELLRVETTPEPEAIPEPELPPDPVPQAGDPIREPVSGSCECPYDTDSAGRSCGKRSAYSKPEGASPKCYVGD